MLKDKQDNGLEILEAETEKGQRRLQGKGGI